MQALKLLIAASLLCTLTGARAQERTASQLALRLVEPAEIFDLRMSSVLGPWLADAGDQTASKDIALAFKQLTGKTESLDVLTQGRIYTMRAISHLAYFDPETATKLLNQLDALQIPSPYTPNMLTYPADVAALELEQAFMKALEMDTTPELRQLVRSVFKAGFMRQPLETVRTQIEGLLKYSRQWQGGVRTLDELNAQLDETLQGLSRITLREYTQPHDQSTFTTADYTAQKLAVDFNKLTCFQYQSAQWSRDALNAKYNHGDIMLFTTGLQLNGNQVLNRSVQVHLDLRRSDNGFDDSSADPGFSIYTMRTQLRNVNRRLRDWGISYPLPAVNSGTALITGNRGTDWDTQFCMEKETVQTGGDRMVSPSVTNWTLRYVLVKMRETLDEAGQTPVSENERRDLALRDLLKEIQARYWSLLQERATKLNNYILSENPTMESLAEKELTEELIGAIFRHDLNPVDSTVWRNVHAKRGATVNQTSSDNHFNAVGYELNLKPLFVEFP